MGKRNSANHIKNAGFTLIELIVAATIVSMLFTVLVVMINPARQLEKAKDVTRQSDLHEMANALDLYYSDNNCYPQNLSYGQNWSQNGVTFISKIPQDSDCRDGVGYCYIYETDSSSCPQWNVLFAKLSAKPATSSSCALEQLDNCLPTNYNSLGYNYCAVLGKVDCSFLSSYQLPVVIPTPTPTPCDGVCQ